MADNSVKPKRRLTPWVIGTLMVVSLAVLIVLQSTNLWKDFTVESSGDLLLLYALTSLNFVAFIIFAFIFLRSIIRLARERRTFQHGAKLKSRLLFYFFAVSLMPIIAMAVFSYLFMNRALDRWFSQIPEGVVREVSDLESESKAERNQLLNGMARLIAVSLEEGSPDDDQLRSLATAGGIRHIEVSDRDGRTIASSGNRETTANDRSANDSPDSALTSQSVEISGGRRVTVLFELRSAPDVSILVDASLAEFDRLKDTQIVVRRVGLLTLGVLTFLLIFASTWIAFYVARGLATPIKALAEGAHEIAKGNLGHRVNVLAEDELGILVNAFNEMSSKLEAGNEELISRRRYIETVIESLPTGVISFDRDEKITMVNRNVVSMLGLSDSGVIGESFESIEVGDLKAKLTPLIKRARRVGHASDQATIPAGPGSDQDGNLTERTVAITATALPDEDGVVLVIEDLSELIAAQRASAWQEVARRMAHEIKNPLTPIQLSAERIAKRFKAGSPASENGDIHISGTAEAVRDVVNESTSTIIREVASLKMMVDEFSRFARLPDADLQPGKLSEAISQAVAAFDGRSSGVSIKFEKKEPEPEIMLDDEQMKRVFVNLIQNAVEAFAGDQVEKEILISLRYEPVRDILVTEIADNGPGISQSDLQKLFQPYFSTKGRGTGLGLAIVKRIILEHHGRIHTASSLPRGAKFVIELPVGN